MSNEKYTRTAMILKKMRRDSFVEGSQKILHEGTYFGGFDSQRRGFGYMEYNSGDRYIGQWKNDMMDGEGVFYRKAKNANFYGIFDKNSAATGMLYTDDKGDGFEIDFRSDLSYVGDDYFWNKAITLQNNTKTQDQHDDEYRSFF
jgi:hypothetical protein